MCVHVCVCRAHSVKNVAYTRILWLKRPLSATVHVREEQEEEEEKEEGLFKADAVNEEDPERDRATQV